ncbi:MAG: ARMT1-like domain-containing protein [Candidatus Saccharicenans sp.]|nr:ARMT1-like domain-containing protein [Candidatus Saccharicenans sp.]
MKAESECYLCLLGQVLRTAGVLGLEEAETRALAREACAFLARADFDRTPPEISEDLYYFLAGLTGHPDPYRILKKEHIERALKLYPELKKLAATSPDPLRTALEISLAGNVIDFGANSEDDWLKDGRFLSPGPFGIDDYQQFKEDLQRADRIVFLGDNAGETVFDRLFIEISGRRPVYAVRQAPIINDATLEEALESGLAAVAELVVSGCRAPGTVYERCSPEFKNILDQADLVISKGQGNFECLEQVRGPFYFLLKAKCRVVSRYLGVPQGSLIIMRSRNYNSRLLA